MGSESRNFKDEISGFIGKRVSVETSEGRIHKGTLVSIDENLNLIIEDAGDNFYKLMINGSFVKEVKLAKAFDVNAFVERLSEVFPGLVKVVENTVIVMDKIRVTEKGVQGWGLAADRVKTLYDQFVKESK
ncbi:MAG: Lsm family RNA-binding protein [Nitrososphaerales archaeon]